MFIWTAHDKINFTPGGGHREGDSRVINHNDIEVEMLLDRQVPLHISATWRHCHTIWSFSWHSPQWWHQDTTEIFKIAFSLVGKHTALFCECAVKIISEGLGILGGERNYSICSCTWARRLAEQGEGGFGVFVQTQSDTCSYPLCLHLLSVFGLNN